MKIIVNGQEREFNNNITLREVLKTLSLEEKVMAAAVNTNIVKQGEWDKFIIREDDKLELLDFVGGG